MLKLDFCKLYALSDLELYKMTLSDLESTSPSVKEHLLSTTSISDERFKRYELGWKDGHNGDSMFPRNFSGIVTKQTRH
jgi:hypothetical protein